MKSCTGGSSFFDYWFRQKTSYDFLQPVGFRGNIVGKVRRVFFLVSWRKTSSTWLPQVPVVIMTSTRDIEGIAAAAPKQN